MNKDRSCTAVFDLPPPSSYELTVIKTGSGTGSVSSAPAGIDCGTDCSEPYAVGTEVTLSAVRGSGAIFDGWDGTCPGSEPETLVTVTGDLECTAVFEQCVDVRDLTGQVIAGARRFEACRAMIAEDFQVQGPAGAVTLVAGEEIVLGNGFEVASGATLTTVLESALRP
jgi:hypothetical protein